MGTIDKWRIDPPANRLGRQPGDPSGTPANDRSQAEKIGPSPGLPPPEEWEPPSGWSLPSEWALPLFAFGPDGRVG